MRHDAPTSGVHLSERDRMRGHIRSTPENYRRDDGRRGERWIQRVLTSHRRHEEEGAKVPEETTLVATTDLSGVGDRRRRGEEQDDNRRQLEHDVSDDEENAAGACALRSSLAHERSQRNTWIMDCGSFGNRPVPPRVVAALAPSSHPAAVEISHLQCQRKRSHAAGCWSSSARRRNMTQFASRAYTESGRDQT